ncbi:helix-hairpin-helix domain-containing protein [Halobellus sp. Atlit-31R]|nr:helix-hairpin-helix domain-containing protein [Halobellus sp. Atlit-31R]
MKVICEDGLTIDCTDFKAIDTGIILLGGEDDNGAVGYVPNERLEYVLSDDVVELEHDRLGVPAPEIGSTEELESRLDAFIEDIGTLRESLDRQVEDLIDEGAPFDQENLERRDRLYERRRTIDRALEQVRKRSQQFQQLSLTEFETRPEARAGTADREAAETAGESASAGAHPGSELDERLSEIEQQLEQLSLTTGQAGGEPEAEGSREAVEETPEESAEETPEERDIEGISGLGPTYHERLESAGIDTLGGLADSDSATVAEAANVTENKAQEWIDRANELVRQRRSMA